MGSPRAVPKPSCRFSVNGCRHVAISPVPWHSARLMSLALFPASKTTAANVSFLQEVLGAIPKKSLLQVAPLCFAPPAWIGGCRLAATGHLGQSCWHSYRPSKPRMQMCKVKSVSWECPGSRSSPIRKKVGHTCQLRRHWP